MWPLVDSTNRLVPAEQLRAAVAVLPRADVVGDPGDDVGVDVPPPRSTGVPSTVIVPGPGQGIVQGQAVRSRGAAPRVIRVVSAFQNRMSNAGGAAQQVVVHPVVPDQVAGAQPGEDLGERPAVQVAAPARTGEIAAAASRRSASGRGHRRLPVVEHRDQRGRARRGGRSRRGGRRRGRRRIPPEQIPGACRSTRQMRAIASMRVEDGLARRRRRPSRRAGRPGCARTP